MDTSEKKIDEMAKAEEWSYTFNLAKNSYQLIHAALLPGHMSQAAHDTMVCHGKIMENIIKKVDEFTDTDAIKTFRNLIGIEDEKDDKTQGTTKNN